MRAGGPGWAGLCLLSGALFAAIACSSSETDRGTGAGGRTAAGSAGTEAQAGESGEPSIGGSGGRAGEAGAAGVAGEAGTTGLIDHPWNEHSQHLEVDCFGFFSGSMRFSAARADLSSEQLLALEKLEPRPATGCSSDSLECNLVITDAQGDVTEFNGAEYGFCDDYVIPLTEELGCKFAKYSAPALPPSSGCLHGFYSSGARVIEQPLMLAEANRTYHVELDECSASTRSGRVTVSLRGDEPSPPLAVGMPVSDPGARGTCLAFDVEVQAPVTATLVITTTAAFDAGDFYMNFR
ncbi:MAG TPA: hypothetical protein VER12_08490 [Polyangiaceae bacterium]|nr:hypothetical protein [Polyangiaceae bacterium]